jgi:hypothetical protein
MLPAQLLRPGCALVFTLGASGCFTEVSLPPAQPPRAPAAPIALPAHVPVGAPQAVQIPGPPPPPRAEALPVCEDDEAAVAGYWDFFGEWSWVSAFCAHVPPGHAYIAPTYADGRYVRGHFAIDEAGRGRSIGPGRVRLVHPPGLILNEPQRRRPATLQVLRQDPGQAAAPLLSQPAPPSLPAYLPPAQQGAPFVPAPPAYNAPAQTQAAAPAQGQEAPKDPGPTLEQCLSKATGRRRDPACVPVLGGELRVR